MARVISPPESHISRTSVPCVSAGRYLWCVIDLHMHSNRSDGTDSPAALAQRILGAGLSAAALTDHDTTVGNEEYRSVLDKAGVGFIPGCEISCLHEFDGVERSAHVLSYFVEEGDTEFQRTLSGLMDDRGMRNARLVERLHELGYSRLEASRIEEISGKPLARSNRPSFATAIIEAYGPGSDSSGVAEGLPTEFTDIQDVFNRLLANDGPAYIKKAHLSPAEAARVAKTSGAICVIAHPIITFCSAREETERWSIAAKRDFLDDVFASLKSDGLAGAEVYYSRHSPEEIEMLLGLTSKHRLVATGGSDFHGENKPDLDVGIGVRSQKGSSAELRVPDSVIGELEQARTELCDRSA